MKKILSFLISLSFALNIIGANDSTKVTIDTFYEVPLGLSYAETHKKLIKLGYKYDRQVSKDTKNTVHGYIANSAPKNIYAHA